MSDTSLFKMLLEMLKAILDGLERMPVDSSFRYRLLIRLTDVVLQDMLEAEVDQSQSRLVQFEKLSKIKLVRAELQEVLTKARAEYLELVTRL